MPNIDFDAKRDERLAAYEPLTFTLAGRKFKTQLPMVRDLLAGATVPDDVAATATTNGARVFLGLAQSIALHLPPKDRARFWGLFAPDGPDFDGQQLIDIAEAITEHHR